VRLGLTNIPLVIHLALAIHLTRLLFLVLLRALVLLEATLGVEANDLARLLSEPVLVEVDLARVILEDVE